MTAENTPSFMATPCQVPLQLCWCCSNSLTPPPSEPRSPDSHPHAEQLQRSSNPCREPPPAAMKPRPRQQLPSGEFQGHWEREPTSGVMRQQETHGQAQGLAGTGDRAAQGGCPLKAGSPLALELTPTSRSQMVSQGWPSSEAVSLRREGDQVWLNLKKIALFLLPSLAGKRYTESVERG